MEYFAINQKLAVDMAKFANNFPTNFIALFCEHFFTKLSNDRIHRIRKTLRAFIIPSYPPWYSLCRKISYDGSEIL